MDACSLRQDQQRGRARWWRSRLCSKTGGSEQGRYILRHSAVGRLTAARISHEIAIVWQSLTAANDVCDLRLLSGDLLTTSPPAEKATARRSCRERSSLLTAVEGSVASLRLDDVARK